MSRGAGLDPVDARRPPSVVLVGSQIVGVGGRVVLVVVVVAGVGGLVVLVVVVVGRVGGLVVVVVVVVLGGLAVVGGPVVGSTVVGSPVVVGSTVVGGSVVGGSVVGGSVVGSQIVVVVASSVPSVSSVVPGSPIMVVAGRRLVVGWAVWRRTGAVRTTLRGLTLAHSLVRCRSLPPAPSFQVLANFAHDLARRRSLAQPPFLQALVGRRSLADSPSFQALAVACAWPLPLGRGPAGTLARPASAGAAMSPATSRAPEATASDDARRTGSLMLRSPIAVSKGSARLGTIAHDHRARASAPTCRQYIGRTGAEDQPSALLGKLG